MLHTTRTLTALVLVATFAGTVRADDAPVPLLRLVGEDVGLLVHVTGGEATVRRALEGPLAERIRDTSAYEQWLNGDDHRNLVRALGAVEGVLGKAPEEFAADLLGQEFAIALYPRPGGEPEAVFLTRAKSPVALSKALSTWDRLQRPTATKVEPYAGHHVRTRTHRNETFVLTAADSVLAVAESAGPVRDVLDRLSAPSDTGSVLRSDRFQRARAELEPDVAAVAYFNPRAWDAALPEPRDEPGRVIKGVFDRVESIVASLRTGDGLVLDAVVRYDGADSDERWQRYVERIGGSPEFLDRVPRRALYVAVGRVDLAEIGRAIYENALSEKDRRRAEPWRRFVERRVLDGLDPIDGLLAAVGPEWGLYVVPREELVRGASPVEGLVAVGLPADGGADVETARRALDDLLTDGLELWVAVHNSTLAEDRAAVRTREQDGTTTRWIEGIGPYRPSFALTPRFLVLTSTPDVVPEFVTPAEGGRLLDDPTFAAVRERYFPNANQVVHLNVPEIRRFVEENRDFLLRELGRPDGDARTVRLDEILGLVDAVFLAGSIDGSHVRLVIGAVVE